MKLPNVIELAKAVGNAAGALAILEKVKQVDVAGAQGTPDIEELIELAKQVPAQLNALNQLCARIFALYAGLVGQIDAILKEQKAKGK